MKNFKDFILEQLDNNVVSDYISWAKNIKSSKTLVEDIEYSLGTESVENLKPTKEIEFDFENWKDFKKFLEKTFANVESKSTDKLTYNVVLIIKIVKDDKQYFELVYHRKVEHDEIMIDTLEELSNKSSVHSLQISWPTPFDRLMKWKNDGAEIKIYQVENKTEK